MVIDFDKVEHQILPNFKGGALSYDAQMHVDGLNRIMKGCLVPGASIGMHQHADSSEVIYVLEGEGHAIIDGRDEWLKPGACHYCPKGSSHTLRNDGDADLVFFAVVPQQ